MRVNGQIVTPIFKATNTSEKPVLIPILRLLGSDFHSQAL